MEVVNISKLFFSLSIIFYKLLVTIVFVVSLNQIANATILNINTLSPKSQLENMVLLDASNLSSCQKESVKMAKCLPANTFQSPKGVLASFYDITWVFGTTNLQGNERILVFADTEKQRDALLALLFLSGHENLWRWNAKKDDLKNILGKGSGQGRGIIRSKYYIAKMRDEYLVLPQELEALKNQGWNISNQSSLTAIKTIIIGIKPLDALARFTQLFMQKTEKHLLKILIHPPQEKLST